MNPTWSPSISSGVTTYWFRIYTIWWCLHNNFTKLWHCCSWEDFKKNLYLYISVKIWTSLRAQYWSMGHGFNILESTIYDDFCIIVTRIQSLMIFKKKLKHFPIYFWFYTLNHSWGSRIGLGVMVLTINIHHYLSI